jgi:hypothetical protein
VSIPAGLWLKDSTAKKGPTVAGRALKVWERMPERQVAYGQLQKFLQVRRRYLLLQIPQLWIRWFYIIDITQEKVLPIWRENSE